MDRHYVQRKSWHNDVVLFFSFSFFVVVDESFFNLAAARRPLQKPVEVGECECWEGGA